VEQAGLFDFTGYDIEWDPAVNKPKLGVLVIDNSSENSGAFRAPIAFVGERAAFVLFAHELAHRVGAVDIYGSGRLNSYASLMGGNGDPDSRSSVHLDPWHKMRLGWCEPQLHLLLPGGSPITLSATYTQNPSGTAILYSPDRPLSEYFMIEFKQSDAGLKYESAASAGVFIWHIKTSDLTFNPYSIERSGTTYPGVWTEGSKEVAIDGASQINLGGGGSTSAFQVGGRQPWGSGDTPLLAWADGQSTNVRLSVGAFDRTSNEVIVQLVS
jgi:hypothetical protein